MTLLSIILVILLLYLGLRLARVRGVLNHLADAAEQGKPFLYDIEGGWGRRLHLERLSRHLNKLISEREKASRQEQNYLRQLDVTLGSLAEAVFVADNSGRLYLANPAAKALFGISGGLEGQKIETIIPSAKFLEFMKRIRFGENPGREQIEMPSKGQVLYLEVAGARIPVAEEGVPDLNLFVLHDITALKRLEGIRKEFVANVSHELRTPVTIIKGYTDTLLEDYPQLSDEERLRFLHKIHKSVGRLNLLLEDLLVLSRLESTGVTLNRGRCSLRRIILETVESVQPRIRECGARVTVDVAPGAEEAWLDPVKISQVIQNLTDNAIRYAKGFSVLSITCERVGERLRVSFRDDGCGIPESDVPHIFERFYRVDKGRSRELGGTGLGLSIVKHIVQLHGGEVRAESSPGKGVLIEIDIPLMSASDEGA